MATARQRYLLVVVVGVFRAGAQFSYGRDTPNCPIPNTAGEKRKAAHRFKTVAGLFETPCAAPAGAKEQRARNNWIRGKVHNDRTCQATGEHRFNTFALPIGRFWTLLREKIIS